MRWQRKGKERERKGKGRSVKRARNKRHKSLFLLFPERAGKERESEEEKKVTHVYSDLSGAAWF